MTRTAIIAFILTFTLAAGVVWEIYEFTCDQVFGTDLQHGNIDTMVDLIVDLIGALIVAGATAIALAREGRVRFIGLFADPSSSPDQDDSGDDPADPAENR